MYIAVEGPIGVGKTTLTQLLGECLNMRIVFEQFEENPFLSRFYEDRSRYAFQTELFFLLDRYRHQQSVVGPSFKMGSVVCDYFFPKTKLFAEMNLKDDEWKLFCDLYDALSLQIARPDLIVYLTASVDNLMLRIFQRDRSFERIMDRNYIARLSIAYESFFKGYNASAILKIDTNNLDFVRDNTAQEWVIDQICTTLNKIEA
jgi:deoxyguanosine kinase